MKNTQIKAIFFAILAAALYALNSPLSKLLLDNIPATMMAALLYLGAGTGMLLLGIIQRKTNGVKNEVSLKKSDLPYTIGMIVLDIAAPIFLMVGLSMTTAANASLLNNFEIVATSIIALAIFKEAISKRLWLGISLVTISSIILSVEDIGSFSFSFGSVFVLLACVCWGFENNCTRNLSQKNPLEIVVVKGLCSGAGSLVIALIKGERITEIKYIIFAMLLGFVAYGLSILFYIYAQRYLGAAKTSAYYAVSPFISVMLSLVIFNEIPSFSFLIALAIMITGAYFTSTESKRRKTMNTKKDFTFEKTAADYDEGWEGKLSEKFYSLVTDNVTLSKGEKLLDVGCGTGTILYRLSKQSEFDGYGIDVEENMLSEAREKCPQMNISLCSCDNTPFDDNGFDAVVACMAYHHFPDKDAFAKESARILKSGGKLFIADPNFPLPVRKVINTALSVHKVVGEFFTADEIAEHFSQYGFERVLMKKDGYAQIIVMEKK